MTASEGPPRRLQVIPKPAIPLTATPLDRDQIVTDVDGRRIRAQAGEWLITRGKLVIEVIGKDAITARYTVVAQGDLTIPAGICATIEDTTGIGTTRSPEALLGGIQRLAAIEIGTVKVAFTPGQLEEIALRARKRGQTVQQSLEAVVDRIKHELFWRA